MAGSCWSLVMIFRFGMASPFGIAVMEDKNGDPLIITYLPLETL